MYLEPVLKQNKKSHSVNNEQANKLVYYWFKTISL